MLNETFQINQLELWFWPSQDKAIKSSKGEAPLSLKKKILFQFVFVNVFVQCLQHNISYFEMACSRIPSSLVRARNMIFRDLYREGEKMGWTRMAKECCSLCLVLYQKEIEIYRIRVNSSHKGLLEGHRTWEYTLVDK